MIDIIIIVLAVVLALFSFVIAFGAPYLPTRNTQREAALDLLDLKQGQAFYDLGCGDGVLLLAAARRGIRAVGYELNPILVVVAWARGLRYGSLVKVHWGNFWRSDIADADGIFVFLIDHHMKRLDEYIKSQFHGKPIKVVSYAFHIPGRKPIAEKSGVFLYKY